MEHVQIPVFQTTLIIILFSDGAPLTCGRSLNFYALCVCSVSKTEEKIVITVAFCDPEPSPDYFAVCACFFQEELPKVNMEGGKAAERNSSLCGLGLHP